MMYWKQCGMNDHDNQKWFDEFLVLKIVFNEKKKFKRDVFIKVFNWMNTYKSVQGYSYW